MRQRSVLLWISFKSLLRNCFIVEKEWKYFFKNKAKNAKTPAFFRSSWPFGLKFWTNCRAGSEILGLTLNWGQIVKTTQKGMIFWKMITFSFLQHHGNWKDNFCLIFRATLLCLIQNMNTIGVWALLFDGPNIIMILYVLKDQQSNLIYFFNFSSSRWLCFMPEEDPTKGPNYKFLRTQISNF